MIACESAVIVGRELIGPGTVVQPLAEIKLSSQEFSIGRENIIEELCSIIDSKIGDFNLIEIKSSIVYSSIGNRCQIGVNASLKNCVIGDGCWIASCVELEDATLAPGSSVYFLCNQLQIGKVDLEVTVSYYLIFIDMIAISITSLINKSTCFITSF